MRSKISKRILDKTPQQTKDKVDKDGKFMGFSESGKQSWNREEVLELMSKAWDKSGDFEGLIVSRKWAKDKWIQENL